MIKNWSPEEEALNLRKYFYGVNKAAFAREHKIPGGASMVSQHLSGHRPMSLAAATAYAKGFGVPLEQISPRIAAQVIAGTQSWTLHRVAEEGKKYLEEDFSIEIPAFLGSANNNISLAPIGAQRVPVISSIQAGVWSEIDDGFQPGDAEDWLVTDIDLSENAFALDICGNSMEPEFKAGDRVIIDPSITPQPGDFVAAKNGEDEATFKKYRPRGIDSAGNVVFELVPLNDDYPTLRSDAQPIKIVGTMVEHRKYRKR
jgi:SOS-response transcriptional repressor LexA